MTSTEAENKDNHQIGDLCRQPEMYVSFQSDYQPPFNERYTNSTAEVFERVGEHSGGLGTTQKSAVKAVLSHSTATKDDSTAIKKSDEVKIDWSKPLKTRTPSVEGDQYPGCYSSSGSDSGVSTTAEVVPDLPKPVHTAAFVEIVQRWRTELHTANLGATEEHQGEEDQERTGADLLDLSPPVTPRTFSFADQAPIPLSPVALNSPCTPSVAWLVSPLRSPLRKRSFDLSDPNGNENPSPISLAKRVRRRVFEDGQGVDPALILAPFEGIQHRENGKRKLEEKPKKTTNMKRKKVAFKDTAHDGDRDEQAGIQDISKAPISFKFNTPLSQRDFEDTGEAAAKVPTDAAPAKVPSEDNIFHPHEHQGDLSTANTTDEPPSGLRHATAKITECEINEIMKHAQPLDDGNYHCAFFVGCNNIYGVRSTFKRHLRDAHSKEKAICPNCRTPLARDDKFTRERHRCQ